MEIFMKQAEKDKPIATTPKGVWEASQADEKKRRAGKTSPGTDLQQNGYPQKQSWWLCFFLSDKQQHHSW